MTDDPGRQLLTGSFHPIDAGEWSAQVYPRATEKPFGAIAYNDCEAVGDILRSEERNLRVRDRVGRTCLNLALLAKRIDISVELIDAGVHITFIFWILSGPSAMPLTNPSIKARIISVMRWGMNLGKKR